MNKKRIIYEIYFPAFAMNIKDMIDKLDYVEELGATSIWFTPIFESPSEHGYNISDYYRIKKQYGTMSDFDKLISVAHKKGIEIFLDLVLCHTDYNNYLFQESIQGKNDCYFWSDTQIDNKWKYCRENKKWYYAPWNYDMPSLNGSSEKVRTMIVDVVKFWLGHGVDGFRLDAVPYISYGCDPIEFWGWFSNMVHEIKQDAYLVAEAWDTYEVSNKYARTIGKSFNFEQSGWIKHSLNNNEPLIIKNNPEYDVNFLNNHDMTRISNSVGHDMKKLFRAVDLLFSLNGDVCLYYGEEIGTGMYEDCHVLEGGHGDWKVRQPMEWIRVEYQRKDPKSLFNYYKKKIREYKEN